jgi:hypothetical protein
VHGIVVREAKPVHHRIDVFRYFKGADGLLNEFDAEAGNVHEHEGMWVDGDEVSQLDFLHGSAVLVVSSRLMLLC